MMIASVQCDFEIGNIAANLEILRHRLQLASENGAKLIDRKSTRLNSSHLA